MLLQCLPTDFRSTSTHHPLLQSEPIEDIICMRTLARLRDEDRIVLRYVDNPNGSVDDIAGVCSEGRNVVGLMPHPERACDELLGSADGVVLLGSLLDAA